MAEQQQTSAPVTDEQLLATLEERVATLPEGPVRRGWEEIVAIHKNWQRCRRIEEATRVKLPPDNTRWGASARPPASTPHAEPPRPSGWQPFTPLTTQPGRGRHGAPACGCDCGRAHAPAGDHRRLCRGEVGREGVSPRAGGAPQFPQGAGRPGFQLLRLGGLDPRVEVQEVAPRTV